MILHPFECKKSEHKVATDFLCDGSILFFEEIPRFAYKLKVSSSLFPFTQEEQDEKYFLHFQVPLFVYWHLKFFFSRVNINVSQGPSRAIMGGYLKP